MKVYIKQELFAQERCPIVSKGEFDQNHQHKGGRTSALNTKSDVDNKRKLICTYCKNEHPPSKCDKVTDVNARKSILRKQGRCFICLQNGHISKNCTKTYSCHKCDNHISICDKLLNIENPADMSKTTTASINENKNNILLQTSSTSVSGVNNDFLSKRIRILFDSGSQRSYITDNVRKELQLPTIRKEHLVIQTFDTEDDIYKQVDIVQVKVKCKSSSNSFCVEAICVPTICSPLHIQSLEFIQEQYSYLQDLELADNYVDNNDNTVQMLIGLNYYYSFIDGKVIKGEVDQPVALSSLLGWIICGQYKSRSNAYSKINFNSTHVLRSSTNDIESDDIRSTLKSFWEFDNLGIDNEENETDIFLTKFDNSIKFNGDRYVVKLPFKDLPDMIPDNFEQSKQRVIKLKSKLKPALLSDYDNVLKDYESNGIIKRVDKRLDPGMVHYLPHMAVIKEQRETTKLRVVFEASSKTKNNLSLNDFLHSGPCLLPLIFSILLRFRLGSIALVADIKQAFLNIEVEEGYRDFLRFLWFDDVKSDNPNLIVLRFLRVLFGLTCSPFLLSGTIRTHLLKFIQTQTRKPAQFIQELLLEKCWFTSLIQTSTQAI